MPRGSCRNSDLDRVAVKQVVDNQKGKSQCLIGDHLEWPTEALTQILMSRQLQLDRQTLQPEAWV